MTDTNEFRLKLQHQAIAEGWQAGAADPDLAKLANLRDSPELYQHVELILRSRGETMRRMIDSMELLQSSIAERYESEKQLRDTRDLLSGELRQTRTTLFQSRVLLAACFIVLSVTLLYEASRWL